MKPRILLLSFALAIAFFQQALACDIRISKRNFDLTMQRLRFERNEKYKLQLSTDFINNNCYNSNQVGQLMQILAFDMDRYQLAERAYPHVADPVNYRRNLAFIGNPKLRNQLDRQLKPVYQRTDFRQGIIYPNPVGYNGNKGCSGFLDIVSFNRIKAELVQVNGDQLRYQLIDNICLANMLSVGQFMQLISLLNSDELRYNLAITHMNRLYDLDNRTSIGDLLSGNFRDQWNTKIGVRYNNRVDSYRRRANDAPIANTVSAISNEQFAQMLQAIDNERFDDNRLLLANQMIKSNGRISAKQVAEMMDKMSFEQTRLELAKQAYQYTIDRENYYLVSAKLKFSTSRNELLSFIQ